MKYIFCSMMFNDIESDLRKSSSPNAVSGHLFQENVLRGLVQNNADVYVLNIPRVRHYPDYLEKKIVDKDFVFDGRTVGKSIRFRNVFLISYYSQYIHFKRELKKIINEMGNEPCVLLTFNSYLIQTTAMLQARRQRPNIRVCDIIGDLHGKYGLLRKKPTVKEKLVDLYGQIEDKIASKSDLFVFLSKYMKEAIPCRDDQYTIIEGIYNSKVDIEYSGSRDDNQKTLVYAGSLDVEYDIEHLLHAFCMTIDPSFQLFIAGNGNGVDLVRQAEVSDERIHYLGVLSPGDLLQYQLSATALISPRRNSHDYVKYSFPSKTMECLALGKPYIAHKLDSEPDEYSDYIQYAEETDEGLKQKIEVILQLPEETRNTIGKKSRDFILNRKNPKEMCKKIIDLCEEERK